MSEGKICSENSDVKYLANTTGIMPNRIQKIFGQYAHNLKLRIQGFVNHFSIHKFCKKRDISC